MRRVALALALLGAACSPPAKEAEPNAATRACTMSICAPMEARARLLNNSSLFWK